MVNSMLESEICVIKMENITKIFPGVVALDNVNFSMHGGEVTGLIGENGAGKSTLIKILTGTYKPEGGVIYINDHLTVLHNPRQAFQQGIAVVHQERNVFNSFSVAENIMYDKIASKVLSLVHVKEINIQAVKFLEMVELNVNPRENIANLSPGEQQMVEIARALSTGAKILLLDEPTASIAVAEIEMLFKLVRRLKKEGYAFVFVSHKLEEVFQICDRVCVLRDGKNAGPILPASELNIDKLVTLMIGRSGSTKIYPVRNLQNNPVTLEVNNLPSILCEKTNSFKLHRGEVLGWYGLVGAGRTELARQIIGANIDKKITIKYNGKDVVIRNINDSIKKSKITYTSENRNIEGLFLEQDIIKNISSSIWDIISNKFGFVKESKEIDTARYYQEKMDIKTPSLRQSVVNLSGGNRQKVSISKCLAPNPEIIIMDEPTVGIDIKTKAEIYEIIWDLANTGYSIILITSDMEELVKITERIIVFRDGAICDEMENSRDYDKMSNKIMQSIFANDKAVLESN